VRVFVLVLFLPLAKANSAALLLHRWPKRPFLASAARQPNRVQSQHSGNTKRLRERNFQAFSGERKIRFKGLQWAAKTVEIAIVQWVIKPQTVKVSVCANEVIPDSHSDCVRLQVSRPFADFICSVIINSSMRCWFYLKSRFVRVLFTNCKLPSANRRRHNLIVNFALCKSLSFPEIWPN